MIVHTRYHTIYVEVWELKLYFYPSAGGFKKKHTHTHHNTTELQLLAAVTASLLSGEANCWLMYQIPLNKSYPACMQQMIPVRC